MLEKRQIIIIILLAVIITLAGLIAFTLLNQTQYQSIRISNGTTIDVPKTDDATWVDLGYGIKSYTCESKHFVLTCFNSQENSNIIGAGGFAIARDALLTGATDVENYNGYQIKENTVNETHFYIVSIANNTTHDNIIIGCDDLGMLKHVLDTLHLGKRGEASQANIAVSPTITPANKTNNTEGTIYGPDFYYQLGLADGQAEGYWNGYVDGYDDLYNIYYPYDDYDYYGYSTGDSGSSSNVETSVG